MPFKGPVWKYRNSYYILYWGRKKNSHGWWRRRRSKLLAVLLLLHISLATTALRQPAATENCYVIITTNGHLNTRVQNKEICWKRYAQRIDSKYMSVLSVQNSLKSQFITRSLCLPALHLLISVNCTLKRTPPPPVCVYVPCTRGTKMRHENAMSVYIFLMQKLLNVYDYVWSGSVLTPLRKLWIWFTPVHFNFTRKYILLVFSLMDRLLKRHMTQNKLTLRPKTFMCTQ
jgi:hypothetical protein